MDMGIGICMGICMGMDIGIGICMGMDICMGIEGIWGMGDGKNEAEAADGGGAK
jgi:hypothetical protein